VTKHKTFVRISRVPRVSPLSSLSSQSDSGGMHSLPLTLQI
jgi:hypothetical protein